MPRLILLIFLFLSLNAYCQVDPAKADSLAREIALKQRTMKAYQDSFRNAQDSIYQSKMTKGSPNHSDSATSLSAETKYVEQKKGRQFYIRLGIAALLLVLLVIGLKRTRKKRNQS